MKKRPIEYHQLMVKVKAGLFVVVTMMLAITVVVFAMY
jgi:hypothetical protein